MSEQASIFDLIAHPVCGHYFKRDGELPQWTCQSCGEVRDRYGRPVVAR